MKKLIAASVSALALMGLAACSDVDDTTTQTVPPADTMAPAPGAEPAAPGATGDIDGDGFNETEPTMQPAPGTTN